MDHHLIYDLLPGLARAYFGRALPASLSYGQAAILALLGLQQREVDAATKELGLPTNQVLALFNKASLSWPAAYIMGMFLATHSPRTVEQGKPLMAYCHQRLPIQSSPPPQLVTLPHLRSSKSHGPQHQALAFAAGG